MADPGGRNSPPEGGAFSQSMPPGGVAVGGIDASSNLQPLHIDASGNLLVAASVTAVASFSTTAQAATTQTAVTGAVVWLAPTQTLNVSLGGSTAVATTTQPVSATGAVVWLGQSQSITAQVSGSVQVSGTVSISGASFNTTAVATTT